MIRLVRSVHKILGLLLSILFLMWFLSGIVMIYHSFPKVSKQLKQEKQKVLTDSLPALQHLTGSLPEGNKIRSLSVDMYLDRPVFHVRGKDLQVDIYADSLKKVEVPDYNTIVQIAVQWCPASIIRVDTVREPDQWIPFGYLKNEFPVYKFIYDDNESHELYIASKTGNILQFTDRQQRVWAWLGAIPHWVYFTALRQNQPAWINFMKWSSGLGAIMCIAGMWLGIQVYYRNRRNGLRSPYRNRWFRWHHISGVIFGVFAITFVFSGLVSLIDLPSWMKKSTQNVPRHGMRGGNEVMPLQDYTLDYRTAMAALNSVKSVEWTAYQQHPYYRVQTDEGEVNIDASRADTVLHFVLTEEMIRKAVSDLHGDSVNYTIDLLAEYDKDYFSRKGSLPLPVYRVIVDDDLHTRHYFDTRTLLHRQVNDDGRLRGLLYSGFHSLNFKFLADRPVLWNIVMYILLLGGTFLSFTGCVLTVKWLIRKIKKCFE